MKKRTGILLSSLFVLGFSFLLVNNTNRGDGVVRDKRIIVELKDVNGTDLESRNEVEQAFKKQLQSVVGLNYRITSNIKHVSNILFIDVNSDDVSKIENLSLVNNVKESKTYTIDRELESFSYDSYTTVDGVYTAPDKNYSKEAMNVNSDSNGGKNTFVAILDDSFNLDHEIFKDLSSDLRYTESQISNLVTTASDFSAKGYGRKNNKIPFYYNYGNASKPLEMTYKNNTSYHGQHVTGIAAGNGDNYQGIAPNAQVALMRLTDDNGSFTSDETILKALNDCVILNVDAINMSFGRGINDFDEEDSLYESVYQKISDLGISSNIAAGNDGRDEGATSIYSKTTTSSVEDGKLGGEALREEATVVGALNLLEDKNVSTTISTLDGQVIAIRDQIINHTYTDSSTNKYTDMIYGDKAKPFYSFIKDGEDSAVLEYEVVPNLGEEKDYANIDVNGKIAVIKRGTITFTEKVRNAAKHGAIGVIIYNNPDSDGLISYFDFSASSGNTALEDQYYRPICGISSADGEYLVNQTEKKIVIQKEEVADYTSNGSSATLQLKPDISAPGSGVYSSIGPDENAYAYYDGTSMATPNYTGAVASLLSDYDGINDETKRVEYRKTITNRFMSTADPIKQPNGAYYSPRLVGAGKVDVSGALKSDVYLKGNVDGKAKVELKNNDDVKVGDVKLSVTAVNESSISKKYKATLYVQAPQVAKIDGTYKDLANYTYKTNRDVLLTSSTSEVTIGAGETTLDFEAKITEENKKYLDSNFENGTYLEGYVVFESLDGSEDLSIPYLGFYGDYDKEEPVEPFSFEKDSNKVYGSDMLNTYVNKNLSGFGNANFASMWVGLKHEITTSELDTIVNKNTASFLTYGKEVGYDSENDEIIVGVTGVSNYTVIQQYVNRTVKDNTITMTNAETGELVLTDHMFSLYYSDTDKLHTLNKTMPTASLISSGIIADRAYTLLDFSDRKTYPEGLYNFKMSYTLVDGSTFTKTYKVRVGAKSLNSTSVEFNDNEIRMSFDGNPNKVTYGGIEAKSILSSTGEKYFIIDKSKLANLKSAYILVESASGNRLSGLVDVKNNVVVFNSDIPTNASMSVKVTDVSNALEGEAYRYKISVYKSDGSKFNLSSESTVYVGATNGKTEQAIKAYSINGSNFTKIAENESGDSVSFSVTTLDFAVSFEGGNSQSSFNPVVIIVISICIGIVIAVTLILLINFRLRKLRKLKK